MVGLITGGRGLALVTAAILSCLLLFSAVAGAAKKQSAAGKRPAISTKPTLSPSFAWKKRDYTIRCKNRAVRAEVTVPVGWRAAIKGLKNKTTSSSRRAATGATRTISGRVRMTGGSGFHFTFRKKGRRNARKYHVRCLPGDFPPYRFVRSRPGGPRLMFVQMQNHYAAIFDRHGVPVWWYRATGFADNAQLLADGTVAWVPVDEISYQQGDYEIRRLNGRHVRSVRAAGGLTTDIHELLLLGNGNYMVGAFLDSAGKDTTPFGGPADTTVRGAQVQELRPDGSLVWHWNSDDHIDLTETGRWWRHALQSSRPWDAAHWNSVERNGDSLLMSFRHLDAVYKIDRGSGEIVWKLGGTGTDRSLEVLGDPLGSYPFGGQHDARWQPDGSVSIFDNGSELGRGPRVVRYVVDEQRGTAKLVESVTDPKVPASICCGSARRLNSGGWLVGWGGNNERGIIGFYDSKGRPVSRLWTAGGFSYRAYPMTGEFPSRNRLIRAMDAIRQRG